MMQVARKPDGRYLPGITGNPGGRPKLAPDVKSALAAGSIAAAQRLVDLIKSEDERVALAASMALLDRVLGKAPASIEVTPAPAAADWDRIQKAMQRLTLEHLEAVHGSAGVRDLSEVPSKALEAVLVLADAGAFRG
jgi:hypothetical protein